MRTPIRARVSMFWRWMALRGVSRGTSTRGRNSFKVTSAARSRRFPAAPQAIPERVPMLQGTTSIPAVARPPLAMAAPMSLIGSCCTSPSARQPSTVAPRSASSSSRQTRAPAGVHTRRTG